MQKKAEAIIKIYNDAALSPQEWEIVGFHVYNSSRTGVLNNILHFHDGLMKYLHSEHFSAKISGQQEFDFGGLK